MEELLDLTGQLASVALFGSAGIGKTSVALSLLHHNKTQDKFGSNRYFMQCDNRTDSLDSFLEHLSDAIHINRTTNVAHLHSYIKSSHPLILFLDGVDLILDPLAPEAKKISATIGEFGSYEHVCLVTTSRMDPEIHGFQRFKVPALSKVGARDAFYGLCNLRSPEVDGLLADLDFHPLSINLVASSVRENDWDESAFFDALDNDPMNLLKADNYQSLKNAMESSFLCPTIRGLGATVKGVLKVIATSGGVEESTLARDFPETARVGEVVDVLCKFFLIYREGGLVKTFSPFRFYFLTTGNDAAHNQAADEDTGLVPAYPAPGGSWSHFTCLWFWNNNPAVSAIYRCRRNQLKRCQRPNPGPSPDDGSATGHEPNTRRVCHLFCDHIGCQPN